MNIADVKTGIRKTQVQLKWNSRLSKGPHFSAEEAQRELNAYYPKEKPTFSQKNTVNTEFDLHIIVPVYNVEKYLTACIDSIRNQKTNYTYCVTFVNDGSTDSSGEILQRYEEKNFLFIEKENGGLSSARNAALRSIRGKYVMFLDSDDILIENAVQTLLETAYTYDAEIVEGGYQMFCDVCLGNCVTHEATEQKSQGRELFGFAWGKIIRSDLMADFCFPEGYLFEDTVMSTLLYPSCKNVYTTSKILYLYRENESGISKTCGSSPRCIDTFWMMKYCLEERVQRGQILDASDLDKYLYALYRNWGRTCQMPIEVQESIFLLSCDLIEQNFGHLMQNYGGVHPKLLKTLQGRSFAAFEILCNNWWLI